jgi:hypothetical protein
VAAAREHAARPGGSVVAGAGPLGIAASRREAKRWHPPGESANRTLVRGWHSVKESASIARPLARRSPGEPDDGTPVARLDAGWFSTTHPGTANHHPGANRTTSMRRRWARGHRSVTVWHDGAMNPAALAALRTPAGSSALAAAAIVADGDPLAAATTLRAAGIPPDLAAAALTQAALRFRAAAKFGGDAERMWFTRAGLEQATRAPVAARRAARLARAGVRSVADLGCGVGSDTIAFARAGLRVTAVDSDPTTAAVAAANVHALGLEDLVTVCHGTAESVDLGGVDAAFCDPARRRLGSRVFDPDAFAPPWSFVRALADTVAATVLKVAPGIDHALVPPGAEAEWVSVDGDVVDATFWCGPLASTPRRATLLRDAVEAGLVGSGAAAAPTGPIGRYVYDPDGAVVRAHLVAEFAATMDGRLGDPTIAYVYADSAVPSPLGRAYEVHHAMPFSLKRLRAELRRRGIGRLTVKKRGSPIDPAELRRDLKLRGDGELTVIVTRVAGAPTTLLCSPWTPTMPEPPTARRS